MNTLPKSERLHGKATVSALMSKGRWGFTQGLKYCYLKNQPTEGGFSPNRIMVSVPKRLFKRAVRRNLLKRRIRESYRTQKHLLPQSGTDVLFLYNSRDILEYRDINEQVGSILKTIGNEGQL
jgi:ribonuclease P protein component